eukprot:XP_011662294.1 PREDICTED: sushi, von Willebrand factor type A, EGF and pentraxin domain-containing protein 1-like [Strongylocentrotus purpuratus]
MQTCPPPVSAPTRCTSPYIPKYASAENVRLVYSIGESVTITCDSGTDRSFTLQCKADGFWTGGFHSCPPPLEAPDKCSAPYVSRYATIINMQLNYDYGDSITVTCDNSSARFYLQCDAKGRWSGQDVSCPVPTLAPTRCTSPYIPKYASAENVRLAYSIGESVTITCDSNTNRSFTLQCDSDGFWTGSVSTCSPPVEVPDKCSAPYVPRYASIQGLQLNYDYGDSITVTCDNSSDRFNLQCDTKGRWNGHVVSCPVPTPAPIRCTSPYIPKYASAENIRFVYSLGESVTITCDSNTDRSFTLQCNPDGFWTGSVLSCTQPKEAPENCSAPYVSRYATIQNLQLNYDYGASITVTCDSSTAQFNLRCDTKGRWRGQEVSCPVPIPAPTRCTSPYIPKYASAENIRLAYIIGESVTITCDSNTDRSFTLQCDSDGFWTGSVSTCSPPIEVPEKCSAPYVSRYATIQNLQLNYDYDDSITVTCDSSTAQFTLRCRTKGQWTGQVVSCPRPPQSPTLCSAPYIPRYSSIESHHLNYNYDDTVTVTCDTNNDQFTMRCQASGLWNGPDISCAAPTLPVIPAPFPPSHASCSAPAVPIDSTIQNLRLSYKDGDRMNVTCNVGSDWFDVSCDDGIWIGQNIVCPDPPKECNPPIIPVVSFMENVKPRYKIGDQVNITCNDDSDWFAWECHTDGLWRGNSVQCSTDCPPPGGYYTL